MNYYERHLGDYAKDTGHLSPLEHGVYNLLLDRYYSTESGIPNDQIYRVARANSKDEKAAVDAVLREFFRLKRGVWIKGRVEEEIAKAQKKMKAAQENGRKGGRPSKPKTETQEKPSGFTLGFKNKTQTKAHQPPDTNHQTPLTNSESGGDDDDGTPNGASVSVSQWVCSHSVRRDLEFLHGVPLDFVDLQLAEFRAYWRDDARKLAAGQWDAKFLQRCAEQWTRSQRGVA